ncbi:MAG: septum formation initiator family protein [Bacteroidetes bacterium]|nr:septum formation initiator family protein [Bacteroidota bacterium]
MAFSDLLKKALGRFRRVVIATSCVAVIIWFVFFDSYSLVSRVKLHQEKAELSKSNLILRNEMNRLTEVLSRDLTPAEIERFAREKYFMSQIDETVYTVVQSDPTP